MRLRFAMLCYFLCVAISLTHAAESPLQIFVAGDVLLGRGVSSTLDAPDNSLQKWRAQISSADLAFCNLECAISPKQPRKTTQLLAAPDAGKYLQRAGFDLVAVANNHALDDDEKGARLTQENALEISDFYNWCAVSITKLDAVFCDDSRAQSGMAGGFGVGAVSAWRSTDTVI